MECHFAVVLFLRKLLAGAQDRGNIDDVFKRVLRDWASSRKGDIVGTWRLAYEGWAIETICERSALDQYGQPSVSQLRMLLCAG